MKRQIHFPEFTVWHIIILVLIMAILTWWWFGCQIGSIDAQIESMHKS